MPTYSSKDDLPQVVWNKKVPNTHLEKFKRIIEDKNNESFESYFDLHKWSIENFPLFWEEVWHYLGIVHSKPYDKVYEKTGPGFLDCEWFSGARFNFAENILRIRDDTKAIIYADEYGCEETVTFAEMFEEVKRYAAAFKKNGLRKGDVVASYMSNRKESVFAYLAAISIGAMFGGPHPYMKSKGAAKFIDILEAKFLLAIDHHSDNGMEFHNIDHLPDIVHNAPHLEKVIIVPTRPETFSRDLSNIKNSCLLEDFLNSGRNPDGTFPDLEFEQLPFSHPICLNFTSGTTGIPKAPVHSAGTVMTLLSSLVICWNLNKGDVLHTRHPVGWSVWNYNVPCLAWGVTLFLYAGSPAYQRQGSNLWDVLSKFKVTYAFLQPVFLDMFEKENIVPGSHTNLENFKLVGMGGSPAKVQNFLFLRDKIKKDAFAFSQYGATENLCTFSGFDLKMPTYAGEIQAPALGMDVRCYNEEGKSIVNERGEMVLATPTPSLPIYLWKDEGNKILKESYLSKYPDVWCQSDEIWINSKTRGFVVMGRTDDTILQGTHRFSPADIYSAIHDMEEVQNYICVTQRNNDYDTRAVLFVKMNSGYSFTEEFKKKVEHNISDVIGYRCVPQLILEIKDIPYNLNNKKMESIVRKIISTNEVPDIHYVRNPECLKYYCDIPEIVNY